MSRVDLLALMDREICRLTGESDHSAAAIMSAAADALRSAEEQLAHDVRRLRLEAGDVVVVTTRDRLTADIRERMQQHLKGAFAAMESAPRVLVLDAGADLKVVGAASVLGSR